MSKEIQVKPAVRALIEKMLTANPEDRITSSDVVQQLENIGRGPFKVMASLNLGVTSPFMFDH
jgi:serine/threonine protein kinase